MAWHFLFPAKAIRLCGGPIGSRRIMTTLNALTGEPEAAYLSTAQLQDHVLSSASVSPHTLRDSLTVRFEILFSSQLLQYTKLL